jgi:hypothetical protein
MSALPAITFPAISIATLNTTALVVVQGASGRHKNIRAKLIACHFLMRDVLDRLAILWRDDRLSGMVIQPFPNMLLFQVAPMPAAVSPLVYLFGES